ncbi:hypothetical protein BC828DRAFT_415968 [Blastocladiella britannica]|nr:hypothetical protein BC828DRAFT_415968 [Blastocladiella britannica]
MKRSFPAPSSPGDLPTGHATKRLRGPAGAYPQYHHPQQQQQHQYQYQAHQQYQQPQQYQQYPQYPLAHQAHTHHQQQQQQQQQQYGQYASYAAYPHYQAAHAGYAPSAQPPTATAVAAVTASHYQPQHQQQQHAYAYGAIGAAGAGVSSAAATTGTGASGGYHHPQHQSHQQQHEYSASGYASSSTYSGAAAPAAATTSSAMMPSSGPLQQRTLWLGNVPPTVGLDMVLDQVHGGALEVARLLPSKSCCFLTFLSGTDAAAFVAAHTAHRHGGHGDSDGHGGGRPLMINGVEIVVRWGKSDPVPIPPHLAMALSAGASRNVYLAGVPLGTSPQDLAADLGQYGDIEHVRIMPPREGHNGAIAFVHFTSIHAAILCVQNLAAANQRYAGRRISYGKDRCAGYPPQHHHQHQQSSLSSRDGGGRGGGAVGSGHRHYQPQQQQQQQQYQHYQGAAYGAAPTSSSTTAAAAATGSAAASSASASGSATAPAIASAAAADINSYADSYTPHTATTTAPPRRRSDAPTNNNNQGHGHGHDFAIVADPTFAISNNLTYWSPETSARLNPDNNRTVYIGGLVPEAIPEDVCNVVRAGLVERIQWMLPAKQCCFVTFVDARAATLFFRIAMDHGVLISGKKVKVDWGRMAKPMRASVAAAVENANASRCVYVGGAAMLIAAARGSIPSAELMLDSGPTAAATTTTFADAAADMATRSGDGQDSQTLPDAAEHPCESPTAADASPSSSMPAAAATESATTTNGSQQQQQHRSRAASVGHRITRLVADQLYPDFAVFGNIESISVLHEKGIAFIHYMDMRGAMRAVEEATPALHAKYGNASADVPMSMIRVNYGRDRCADPVRLTPGKPIGGNIPRKETGSYRPLIGHISPAMSRQEPTRHAAAAAAAAPEHPPSGDAADDVSTLPQTLEESDMDFTEVQPLADPMDAYHAGDDHGDETPAAAVTTTGPPSVVIGLPKRPEVIKKGGALATTVSVPVTENVTTEIEADGAAAATWDEDPAAGVREDAMDEDGAVV